MIWKSSYRCFSFDFQVTIKEDVIKEADDSATDEKQSKSNKENDQKAQKEDKTQEQSKPSNVASTSLCTLV